MKQEKQTEQKRKQDARFYYVPAYWPEQLQHRRAAWC